MQTTQRKTALVALTILVALLISTAIYADCDMMALITKKGKYISWLNTSSGYFNDPYDFFTWQKARSNNDHTVKANDDGYGVIYHPADGSFNASTQSWFQTDDYEYVNPGTQYPYDTFYTDDGSTGLGGWDSNWQDALDDAEEYIMDNDTEASIVLTHARQGSTGEGNHPFYFTYTDPVTEEVTTFTFMHNGTIDTNLFKPKIRTFLQNIDIVSEDDWFELYPSNWMGTGAATAPVGDFIDSELWFHYLMYNILNVDGNVTQGLAKGDVIQGLYDAMNEVTFHYDPDNQNLIFNVQTSLRNSSDSYSANFIMSDGINIYAFRNDNDDNHSLGIHENNSFIGIRTYGRTGNGAYGNDYELDKYELAVFTPYSHPYDFSYAYSPTRLPYFLQGSAMPTYLFLKGNISSDISLSSTSLDAPRVWITGDINLTDDVDIVDGTAVGVLDHVTIDLNGYSLTIEDDAALHLNHASTVLADMVGSELYLDWGSTITGATAGWYEALPPGQQVEGEQDYIDGDKILAIDGGIITTGNSTNPGDQINIYSSSGELWEGIQIDNPSNSADFWFVNCKIRDIVSLSIERTNESSDVATLNIYDTEFYDCAELLVKDDQILEMDGCDIHDNTTGINIYDAEFYIEDSEIYDNSTGININYVSDEESYIQYCDIYDNNSGFINRDGEFDFSYNDVYNNKYDGVYVYSAGTFTSFDHNQVYNNGYTEYVGYEASFLDGRNGSNIFSDTMSSGGNDLYLLKALGWKLGDEQILFGGNTVSIADTTRFYPYYCTFDFEIGREFLIEIYTTAREEMIVGNYSSSASTFEYIIDEYPESNEAVASIQNLYFIEQYTDRDFISLIQYYESLNVSAEHKLYRAIRDMTIKSYMQNEDFETAIQLLEPIINNPANDTEYVDAVIDEAYSYLKLYQSGSRISTNTSTVKPTNHREFQAIVNDLYDQDETEEPINNDIVNAKVEANNYPNPFNPTTIISFSIHEDSKVELNVYNVKGQLVKTLVNDFLEKGKHTVEWNGSDSSNKTVASGIYFYKVSSGKSSAMKKMLLLK